MATYSPSVLAVNSAMLARRFSSVLTTELRRSMGLFLMQLACVVMLAVGLVKTYSAPEIFSSAIVVPDAIAVLDGLFLELQG